MDRPLLGTVLVDNGYIGSAQLDGAVAEQRRSPGRRLGQVLLESGAIDEETLVLALAKQGGFGQVDPRTMAVEPDLLEAVSHKMASSHQALPLHAVGPQLVRVAMTNPLDLEARRDLEFALGRAVDPVVAKASDLRDAIEYHYGLGQKLETVLDGLRPGGGSVAPRNLARVVEVDVRLVEDRLRSGAAATPYVDLLNFLLANARQARASDIHLEPQQTALRVRYRIDGELRPVTNLPKWVERGLISRIKVVGGMDVSRDRVPQEGRIRASIGGSEVDLRVSLVPSQFGETCVVRLLDPAILELSLAELGYTQAQLQAYYRLLAQPQGIVLVTGPTGSGKSTTLYATINRLMERNASIVTVEDPVEYTLEGVTQLAVSEHRGITYPSAIRWLLRQDPDVIIVGEIRDAETAAAAFQAALTGHLVFATLHTPDTVTTVTRLRDLGVPPYLTSSTLLGVVAQRLVRCLCSACSEPGEPSLELRERVGAPALALPGARRVGRGCRECAFTGYHGRVGVFELLPINDTLRNLVHGGADAPALRRAAIEAGLLPMWDSVVDKVAQGRTCLEEVLRHADAQTLRAGQQHGHAPTGAPGLDRGSDVRRPPASASPGARSAPSADVPSLVPTTPPPDTPLSPAPMAPVGVAGAVTSAASGGAQPAETVLVVDDSQEILDLVRYTLEDVGYRVLTADGGRAALRLVAEHRLDDPIHLVVLDVMMPDMSGFEVAQQLKQDIATAFLPILILSARGEQAYVNEGFRAGADDYLPKPFDPEELELRVKALLRRTYHGRTLSLPR